MSFLKKTNVNGLSVLCNCTASVKQVLRSHDVSSNEPAFVFSGVFAVQACLHSKLSKWIV
jgi:hypothetical protein